MAFDLLTAFTLGLLTPLTAVCVLPLYPGFLAYLSNRTSGNSRFHVLLFSMIVTLGVIVFMLLIGLLFTWVLEISLTKITGIISPIAFSMLGAISIFLILDVDLSKYMPHFSSPRSKSPFLEAFLFGFFFGAIVLPCNPLFIAALFAKSIATTKLLLNILQFLAFGVGIGFPLIFLSAISATAGKSAIKWLTKHKKIINLVTGILMLAISIYYLIFVFRIF